MENLSFDISRRAAKLKGWMPDKRLVQNHFLCGCGGRGAFRAVLLAAVAAVAAAVSGSPAFATKDPIGIWLDHTKRGAIEIYSCGNHLCGRVVWMRKPLKTSGEPFRDRRNPKKALRNRTICGMKMLGRLRSSDGKTWDGGWIYDPERGQSFDALVKVRGENKLTVTGYLLAPAFGKSFVWTRAPEDIGRCAPAVKAATLGN